MRRPMMEHAIRLASVATTVSALAAAAIAIGKGTQSVQFQIASWAAYTTGGTTLIAISLLFWGLFSSSYRRHRATKFRLRGGYCRSYVDAPESVETRPQKGDALPTVDPADLQNVWAMLCLFQGQSGGQWGSDDISLYERVCRPDADVYAVWFRASMLRVFAGMLEPWTQNGEFDDVVFQIAATFPMKKVAVDIARKVPPFDVGEFVKQIRARVAVVSRESYAIQ